MPEKVLNQIKYLCKEIPKVEWSGILFYSIEGTITNPENMVLTLQTILPMQKGTAAFTEYSFDERVVEFMMDNEETEDWKIAHIHSHNTMAVYFSGTDWSELEDNAPNHNIYLSLIVNNFMDFCAKVCFIANGRAEKVKFVAKDENGNEYTFAEAEEKVENKKLVVYDCDIDAPVDSITINQDFADQVEGIIKDAEKRRPVTVTYYGAGFNSQRNVYQGNQNAGKNWNQRQQNANFTNPGVDAWGDAEWGNIIDSEEDMRDDAIEEFTMFALNTGNDVSQFKDIEDVLDFYKAYNVSPKALAKGVLDKYVAVYEKYFDKFTERDNPSMFIDITNGVIENLDSEIWTTTSRYVKNMLSPVKKALESMLSKFVKYEKV